MNDAPQLLIEWSSPWPEFVAAIGPALRRSPPELGMEAKAGLFPLRGIVVTLLLEAAALAAIALPAAEVRPVLARVVPDHDVIYFSADELPRTEDLGGAPAGTSGRSGGSAAHHPLQTIKVARGESVQEKVADAPQLKLPTSESQLANLLAYRADAGPAPAEALNLSRQGPQMAAAVVPPRQEIQYERLRPAQLANPEITPPPVELPGNDVSSRHIFHATTAVVPPPVSAPARAMNNPARLSLPPEGVVAPRPEIGSGIRSGQPNNAFTPRVAPPEEVGAVRLAARTPALSGESRVVPPPTELQDLKPHAVGSLGNAAVAGPPSDLNHIREQRSLNAAGISVVPPPAPTSTNRVAGTGDGKGPPSSATGVVISPEAGEKPGIPANSQKASLAMSPAGIAILGTGGDSVGTGISHASGSGSSASGGSSGAAAAGAGKGASSPNRTGNSSYPGPGGAGSLASGSPRVPGVSVSGGSNVVTLPSFGATPATAANARSSVANNSANGITIVASPRSGGAMNLYGALKGDRVYTIYIRTNVGTAVMQFSDPASAAHPYASDLIAPTPLRAELPPNLRTSRLIVSCVLDRSGEVKKAFVLQSDADDFEGKVMSALPDWKFSPAFRGKEAVEINAILGFGVDTK